MQTVEIFWTGGYDSTFRICQLSQKQVIIKPYYLSYKRASEQNELDAINKIYNMLLENPNTKAKIEPIKYISVEEREMHEEIFSAFSSLTKKDFMGNQYIWLASFALKHPGIELSVHKDDKAILLIEKHGALKKEESEYGDYYVIDKEKSPKELVEIFGNQHFPLVNYTKLQMKKEYEEMGLSAVVNETWFCHTPKNGKACGCCNPCRYTIEEGMAERFTPEALAAYKKSNRFYNKILRKLKKMRKLRKIFGK